MPNIGRSVVVGMFAVVASATSIAAADESPPDPTECIALDAYHSRLEQTARRALTKSELFRDRVATLGQLRKELADEAWWKTSDAVVIAAVTKRAMDTIIHLVELSGDMAPELVELKLIPAAYDCAQEIVAATKGKETRFKDCVASRIRREKLKASDPSHLRAVIDGVKIIYGQVRSLQDLVKTEQQRLESKKIVETQLASIDRQLLQAEDDFSYEQSILDDLEVEAQRIRKRIAKCGAQPAPTQRRLRGRPPLATRLSPPPGAPLRAVIATTILSDPSHAYARPTLESLADARTIIDDAESLRAAALPATVQASDVSPIVDTSGRTAAAAPTDPALRNAAVELSHALGVAERELDLAIHRDLLNQLHARRVTAIDLDHLPELVDKLYPAAASGFARTTLALITDKRIEELRRKGKALLEEAGSVTNADTENQIRDLASVIASTRGRFGAAVAKAQQAATSFQEAVRSVKRLTEHREKTDLPLLQGAALSERQSNGTSVDPVSEPTDIVARPRAALDEAGDRVNEIAAVASSANELVQLLPVSPGVKHAFSEASRIGGVASQLVGAALSGNPLSAISTLGSLFGGPDQNAIEAQHHEEVMEALGVLAKQQRDILELGRQIRVDIAELRREVQAMQAAIMAKLKDLELAERFDRRLIVSVASAQLNICWTAADKLREYWAKRGRGYFVFDANDEEFVSREIPRYMGSCAHGLLTEVEGSDPRLDHLIRPLFAASSWEPANDDITKLQSDLLPKAYELEDVLRGASVLSSGTLRSPSRTWSELQDKVAALPDEKLPAWYRQADLLSPAFITNLGAQVISILPLLEIATDATGDQISLCRMKDVADGNCWRSSYARNSLEAFTRIVDVALYQQALLAGDALLPAALDAFDSNVKVPPALLAYVRTKPMLARNLGLVLALRATDRTSPGWYGTAWALDRPDALEALLHVSPIVGEPGNWSWQFQADGETVVIPLPVPEQAELRILEVPSGLTSLSELRTRLANEVVGYELATKYRNDGRAFVDAVVKPAALPAPVRPSETCRGCNPGGDGALGIALVLVGLRRQRRRWDVGPVAEANGTATRSRMRSAG